MPRKVAIATAGNVLVPAYLALQAKGYRVSRFTPGRGREEAWRAAKAGEEFTAEDPLSLLGLVALYETRGARWQATDEEIDGFFQRFP